MKMEDKYLIKIRDENDELFYVSGYNLSEKNSRVAFNLLPDPNLGVEFKDLSFVEMVTNLIIDLYLKKQKYRIVTIVKSCDHKEYELSPTWSLELAN